MAFNIGYICQGVLCDRNRAGLSGFVGYGKLDIAHRIVLWYITEHINTTTNAFVGGDADVAQITPCGCFLFPRPPRRSSRFHTPFIAIWIIGVSFLQCLFLSELIDIVNFGNFGFYLRR